MVIVRISHGLGNQMFQYAAGRALAIANHVPLKLDLTHFQVHHDRIFGLGHFLIAATPATEAEVTAISGCAPGERKRGLARHWDRLRHALNPWDRRRVVREASRRFDPRVLDTRGELYLMGYWQARGYVEKAADTVRSELTVATPPSSENARWLDIIRSHPSVAIHVRRGDYVGHSRFEMAKPLAYYREAFAYLAERCVGLHAYVFSDNILWAEANLRLPVPTKFLHHNAAAPHEDLRLMSACDNQIIANSTFSWWAAWLNPQPRKIICAPQTWFNTDPEAGTDLLPPEWNLF
jgi:hypothetical protein